MPPTWLNWLLSHVFASERYLINLVSLPLGVSLIVLAQKV